MPIELVMLSIHLILCYPLLLLPSIFPSIRALESLLVSRFFTSGGEKYCSFSISISPSNEYSELVSLRIDWFDLLAVQENLKSLQQHNSKASIFQHSAFFMVQLLNPKDMPLDKSLGKWNITSQRTLHIICFAHKTKHTTVHIKPFLC